MHLNIFYRIKVYSDKLLKLLIKNMHNLRSVILYNF